MAPDLSELIQHLKQAEGWREHAYIDTKSYITLGYGFNLGKLVLPPGVDFRHCHIEPVTALPEPLGDAWLLRLVRTVLEDLAFALPWVNNLDEVRQAVLAEMGFNLGVAGLLKWPHFLGQVQRGEYAAAADNMKHTLWHTQVGTRAVRLEGMMRSGRA